MSPASISTDPSELDPSGPPRATFDPAQGEPLSLLETAPPDVATHPRTRGRGFEFSCRGDRVGLELLAPEGRGPFPSLVVVEMVLEAPETWLEAGVAVASITPPLFGRRRSPKFTEKLESAIAAAAAGRTIDATGRILWSEFIRQSVLELRRGLDALEQIWQAAPEPVVFAGSGPGASIGAVFCAVDERVRAAALTSIVKPAPDGIDPAVYLDEIAPRPLLLLDGDASELQAAAWKLLSPLLAGE